MCHAPSWPSVWGHCLGRATAHVVVVEPHLVRVRVELRLRLRLGLRLRLRLKVEW